MHVWTQSLELSEIEHCLKDWVDTQQEKQQQVSRQARHLPRCTMRESVEASMLSSLTMSSLTMTGR